MAVLTGGFGEDVFVFFRLLAGFLEQWAMESRIPFECVLGMHVPAGQVQIVFMEYEN